MGFIVNFTDYESFLLCFVSQIKETKKHTIVHIDNIFVQIYYLFTSNITGSTVKTTS